MSDTATRPARIVLVLCSIAAAIAFTAPLQAQKAEPARAPNYDLASQWTPDKVRKLVFDTSVTPRWLEKSDRFWYAYQTREGRRFMFVDPIKKTKAPLFDHAKMAASLTSITRIPYDAQHLPFSTVRFVRNDAAFEFDVQVPADAVIATPPKRTTTEQGSPLRQQEFDEPQATCRRRRRGAPGAEDADAALRVRPGLGEGHAARGLQGRAASAALGVDVARRQDRGVRPHATTST